MKFRATVIPSGNATAVEVPAKVLAALGPQGRPPVAITINGHTWRSRVAAMRGQHLIGISAANRTAAGIAEGDAIEVDVVLDDAPRDVELPADLAAEFKRNTAARTAFEHLQIVARPKLTGRRGIQIWVPAAGDLTFENTRAWVEELSRTVGQVMPELVSWRWQVSDRRGRARLDYTQNAINKTLIAPYSPRPAPGAPVSAPIDWDELDDPELAPDRWTIRTIGDRLARHGDLFRPVLRRDQTLPRLR